MHGLPALCAFMMAFAGTSIALARSAAPEAVRTGATANLKADLPWDPAIVRGTLENGLTYMVVKHANPPGRAVMWMHVSSGSLNETEDMRGLAHYLEHMAFNGSKNFPPGSVVDFFQSLGMQFGRDQNAFTSFDQTTYQLTLPDAKQETLDRGLLFFSDVAGRLSLLENEIEEERGVIAEERRTRLGAQQRIQDYVLPRIAPESIIGHRLPIGTAETINSVQKPQFERYYTTYYAASNITMMVVADTDPQMVIDRIKAAFGELPTRPKPADQATGVVPTKGQRAIVATDPDLKKTGEVSITRVELPKPPTTTVAQMRDDLVDTIGQWAFNRRLSALQSTGEVTFSSGSAGASNMAGAMRLISVSAGGDADNWRTYLTEVCRELQRARLHGFTEQELADARAELISSAQNMVQRESTIASAVLMRRMNTATADGEPVMSAKQRLEQLEALLPTITPSEVSQRFAALFDMTNMVAQAELPGDVKGGLPSEADLIAAAAGVLNVKPEAPKAAARATALLTELPAGGKIIESKTDSDTQVTTARLDNGITVHYRFMDINKNAASVNINLAGGTINETAANRGVTDVAGLAWARPATSTLSSTQIRDLMVGKNVSVGGGGGGGGRGGRGGGGGGGGGLDSVSLSISGNPADFETGFQLAYLMLTDPVIEDASFTRWKEAQLRAIEGRKVTAMGVMMETAADAIFPKDEVRTKPLTVEQVNALSVAQAQAWLEQIIATAPIEVTIIGDIKAEQVMPLVEKYLGALPARGAIGAGLFADKRKVDRPTGPIQITKTVPSQTDQAMVVDGFFGPDAQNIRDTRLMQIAARVLSTRMTKVIREQKQLVYSIGASLQPGRELPGFGRFQAAAPTDPQKAALLGPALEALYDEFAKGGPTEEEMATVRKQFAVLFDEQMKDTGYWMTRLADLTYRGFRLSDITEAPAFFQSATPEEVREAFARYYKPENKIRFVMMPSEGGAADDQGAGKSETK